MEDELATLLMKALSIADRLHNIEVGICLDQALCHLGRQPPIPFASDWSNDELGKLGTEQGNDLMVRGLQTPRAGDEP